MVCKKCGMQNAEGAQFCECCGERLDVVVEVASGAVPVYKETSAIFAIVVSFFCTGWIGIIFGILSLVEGGKVKTLVNEGRLDEAQMKLNEANKWSKIAWIVNAVLGGLTLLVVIFNLIFVFGMIGLSFATI